MRSLQIMALILMSIVNLGCQQMHMTREQYIRNRANDYLRTSLIEPLRVPEGFSHPHTYETYPLPSTLPQGPLEPASVVPPGFGTLKS